MHPDFLGWVCADSLGLYQGFNIVSSYIPEDSIEVLKMGSLGEVPVTAMPKFEILTLSTATYILSMLANITCSSISIPCSSMWFHL